MSEPYSTYEVKAKFSAILREVREGKTITVSYRGEPVAEIRPLGGAERKLAQCLRRLEDRGVLRRPAATAVALATGYLRGADLWHVACALYLVEEPREMSFLTLDDRQRAVVQGLGFPT